MHTRLMSEQSMTKVEKAAARYQVVSLEQARRDGWVEDEFFDAVFRHGLFDTFTTPPELIFSDGGESEDQTLDRDLRSLVDELNKVALELKEACSLSSDAKRERETVVAWLRTQGRASKWILALADSIARGEHHPK
jgi:hypothetical protein